MSEMFCCSFIMSISHRENCIKSSRYYQFYTQNCPNNEENQILGHSGNLYKMNGSEFFHNI